MRSIPQVKLKLELQELASILDEVNKPVNIEDRKGVCDELLSRLQKVLEENNDTPANQRFEQAFHYEDFLRLNRMIQQSRDFDYADLKRYMSAYFVKFERDNLLPV